MRAEYEPTAEQRALVENASAIGITQAEIANQLKIDEKTLRKHFRVELSSGKFKIDMLAGKTVAELMKSKDERVRRSMRRNIEPLAAWAGKRPTSTSRLERTTARSKPRDVSAIDIIRARIADASARLGTGSDSGEPE
jgi:hypothetical protein